MCTHDRPHVTVPGSVKRLRAHAFQNARIASLFLEEGVQTLEACSLAADSQTTVTVPASASDVTDPLFRPNGYIRPPRVYAYSGTEAARLGSRRCSSSTISLASATPFSVAGSLISLPMEYMITEGWL